MANVIHLGTSDEITTCECCGKAGLKLTVALDVDGEVVHYGTTCAARATGLPVREIKAGAKSADEAREEASRKVREAKNRAHQIAWARWLEEKAPVGGCVFRSLEKLGGYSVAHAMFVAEGHV